MRSRGYCFTLNNYTAEEVESIRQVASRAAYLVFGFETGENGTPHLQGYVYFQNPLSALGAKRLISQRAHIELQRGTHQQAAEYCKKQGSFEEFGTLPAQGKRSDFSAFRDWIATLDRAPTTREVLESEFCNLYCRYKKGCDVIIQAYQRVPTAEGVILRDGWQSRVYGELMDGDGNVKTADSRKVRFIVDSVGNQGKSFLADYLMRKNPEKVQLLRVGKRDDLAHMIDEKKKIFVFDVPRSEMQYFQYSVLEMLKDGWVCSPKYESRMKYMECKPVHVVVLCNEEPDYEKMSEDRYDVEQI